MMCCGKNKIVSKVLLGLSFLALIFSGVVFFFVKEGIFGIAGTQWILISVSLAVYALLFQSDICERK